MRLPALSLRAALCLAVLSGCSGSTDPATAHLFDNIANLNSGEYDRQIARKDAEAAAIVRANRQMEGNIAAMRHEAAGNRQTIAALRGQIAAARREASAARSSIGQDSVRLGRLADYESQLAALEADAAGGSDPAVLEREVARIRASIRALSN